MHNRLTGKVFKLLPLYEQDGYENYYKYLSRLIIELSGESQTDALEQTLVALKGLYRVGEDIDHTMLKRTVMRYTAKLSQDGDDNV